MRIRQHNVFDERALIGSEPAEIGDEQHGGLEAIHDPEERVGVRGHDDVVSPVVPPPILGAVKPAEQLLLGLLVAVLRRSAAGGDDEAEGGEEGDVEEVGLVRVGDADHRRTGPVWVGSEREVLEEVPLGHVLVAGVGDFGDVIGGRRAAVVGVVGSGEGVVADHSEGEAGREVVEVDLDYCGGGRRREGDSEGDGIGRGGRWVQLRRVEDDEHAVEN